MLPFAFTFVKPFPQRNPCWCRLFCGCSFPTATSGCRGLFVAGSLTPGFFVCLRDFRDGSRGSPVAIHFRSLQTSVPVTQRSRGYPAPHVGELTSSSTPAPTSPIGLGKSLPPHERFVGVLWAVCVCRCGIGSARRRFECSGPIPQAVKACSAGGVTNGCHRLRSATGDADAACEKRQSIGS